LACTEVATVDNSLLGNPQLRTSRIRPYTPVERDLRIRFGPHFVVLDDPILLEGPPAFAGAVDDDA
jgi:hypothetical protein